MVHRLTLTALNLNEKDKDNYVDKFYDIDVNEKEAHDDQRAVKKNFNIKPGTGSLNVNSASYKLSVHQRERAVKNIKESVVYSTGDSSSTMAELFKNITIDENNDKSQFSMRSDSEGRELTPQQQEYFKNSKA